MHSALRLLPLLCAPSAALLELQRLPWKATRTVLATRAMPTRMVDDTSTRIARLEATLSELESAGCSEDLVAPLKVELAQIKLAEFEARVQALKASTAEGCVLPAPKAPPPPPPPPPPPRPAPKSGLKSDVKEYVSRLAEISFEIEASQGVELGSSRRVEALRSERKTLFEQLRQSDQVSFEKTVELLQASYNIPASDLPGGAASSAPSRPPSAPPADDDNVVIIGGRRYKLSSDIDPRDRQPAPAPPVDFVPPPPLDDVPPPPEEPPPPIGGYKVPPPPVDLPQTPAPSSAPAGGNPPSRPVVNSPPPVKGGLFDALAGAALEV